MSSQKKPRPKMQIGPLTAPQASSPQTPPSLTGGFTSTQFQSQQRELNIDLIRPRQDQPRRTFNEDSLDQLTQSVRTHGILQPLAVHLNDGQYDLIAGERRLRAARAAGLTEVPVRVFENMSKAQIKQLAALENLQREDLNPVDETDAIMDILSSELRVPRAELTARLEKLKALKVRNPDLIGVDEDKKQQIEQLERIFPALSRGAWTSFVANRLPVLRLPSLLLEAVRAGELDYTKAIAIKPAPPVLHEKLIAQSKEMGIQELRKTVRESAMSLTQQADFQEYDSQVQRLRRKLSALRMLELDDKKRDYLVQLLNEVEAVLDDRTRFRKKMRLGQQDFSEDQPQSSKKKQSPQE